MNCIAVIAPKKNTVGTAIAWIANQRTVKIGYVIASFVVIRKGGQFSGKNTVTNLRAFLC